MQSVEDRSINRKAQEEALEVALRSHTLRLIRNNAVAFGRDSDAVKYQSQINANRNMLISLRDLIG